jgi:hypothetical protein
MNGTVRLRRVTLLATALAMLLGGAAGVAHAGDADQLRIRSSAVLSPTGLFVAGQADGPDTRLQRPAQGDVRAAGVRHDSVTGSGSEGQRPAAWAATLAAVLERAGHPERTGHIVLRGPPGSST